MTQLETKTNRAGGAAPPPAALTPARGRPARLVPPTGGHKAGTTPDAIKKGLDPLLHRILSAARGWGSETEKAFNDWLVNQIKAFGATPMLREMGQIVVEIEAPEGSKRVMFACHTDTTDSTKTEGTKTLEYDSAFERVTLAEGSNGECLGADDGAGVWMLLKMIQAKVPGVYVFHRGEERGCIGANEFKNHAGAWLKEFDIAVEFDRPGDTEIITHQGGQRCASDTFGKALQRALEPTLSLDLSDRGVLTDVRVYRTMIPEVVNIGVDYRGHHTTSEELDVGYLMKLLTAVKTVDWGALPVERDPSAADPVRTYPFPTSRSYGSQRGFGGLFADNDDDDPFVVPRTAPPVAKPATPPPPAVYERAEDGWDGCTLDDVRHYMDMQDSDEAALEIAKLLLRVEALRSENALLKQLLGM